MYWGAFVNKRPDRLLSNVIWAGIIGHLPFLFFPFIYSIPYVLFASAVYMTMLRGVVPGWMEIFKLNLPGAEKQKVFSTGSIISYVVGAVFPLVIGPLLDHYLLSWRWIFPISALIGMSAIFFQKQIPLEWREIKKTAKPTLSHRLGDPWKNAYHLLKTRPDFRAYQIGFMLFGGCGLMIMQPALPQFFIGNLCLSYTELSIALTLCKGVGFALTSPLWARGMEKIEMFRFNGLITLFGALFIVILLSASWQVAFVYLAYFMYGVMQAGSELSWHLSGPQFALDEDSSIFSNVNVLTVGLRGVVIPQIGSLMCLIGNPILILLVGAISCLTGSLWMITFQRKKALAAID
jgi:hypothetical protein